MPMRLSFTRDACHSIRTKNIQIIALGSVIYMLRNTDTLNHISANDNDNIMRYIFD